LLTGAMSSATNTWSKSTSLDMDPRTDMASQVSSMVSPGWAVGSNIQRLCSFGGSDPFQSGGGP